MRELREHLQIIRSRHLTASVFLVKSNKGNGALVITGADGTHEPRSRAGAPGGVWLRSFDEKYA